MTMEAPFALVWTAECPRMCALFGLLYLAVAAAVESTRPRLRPGVEHGSARWGDARDLNARFAQRGMENVLLTRNVRLGLDGRRHRRNLNVLVVGVCLINFSVSRQVLDQSIQERRGQDALLCQAQPDAVQYLVCTDRSEGRAAA